MKGFRVPILGAMALVALTAADCLALRWLFVRGNRSVLLVSGLLPLINVLAVTGLLGLRGLAARRRCPSFLLGLQAFGWAAVSAYAIACMSPPAFELAMAYLGLVLGPVDALIGRLGLAYDDSSRSWRLLSDACSSVALSAPLVGFGVVGGYLSRRFEVWLARGTWFRAEEGRPVTPA